MTIEVKTLEYLDNDFTGSVRTFDFESPTLPVKTIPPQKTTPSRIEETQKLTKTEVITVNPSNK